MIKRVKASEIDPETMRLVRGGAGDDATSVEIDVAGRVCDRNGNESICVETAHGGIKLYAPNEMVRVEMIEPTPTTTTITIEVPAGSEDSIINALGRTLFDKRNMSTARAAISDALARYRRRDESVEPDETVASPLRSTLISWRGRLINPEGHAHEFKPDRGVYRDDQCVSWIKPDHGSGNRCGFPADHQVHIVDRAAEQAAYWAMRRDSARRDTIGPTDEQETNKIEHVLCGSCDVGLPMDCVCSGATLAQSVANNAARTVNPMRTDAERHEAHAFIGPLVSVTRTDCGTPGCPCVSGEVEV